MAKTSYEVTNNIKYYFKYIELPRDSTGKRKRKKIRARSVGELNKKIDEFKNNQKLGIVNQDLKFGDLFKEWLYSHHIIRKKSSTIEYYERIERLYITPSPLYGIKIKNLNAFIIQNWYNTAEITPYLLQAVDKLIRPFLKYLYKGNYTLRDFSQLITTPPYQTKSEVQILTKSEQSLLIKNCTDDYKYSNAIKFAIFTGIRIGELEALTWDDVNGNKLTINKTFRYIKELNSKKCTPTISSTKTNSSKRTIILNDKSLEILNDQKNKYDYLKSKLGNKFTHPELIFFNSQGNYSSPQALRTCLNTICRNSDLPKIKFHALRHTFASRLIEGGLNIKLISSILGHASTAVTERVYIHIIDEFKENSINIINSIFSIF